MSHGIWTSFSELNALTKDKKIIFFGKSEDWVEKTLRAFKKSVAYIVDNNQNLLETDFSGIPVLNPKELLKETPSSFFIVITSGSFESVVDELCSYQLKPGIDFCCSPVLNNQKILADIHNHDQKLLVASPDHVIYSELDKKRNIGGGLYTYDISTHEVEKITHGSYHQLVRGQGCFYAINHFDGIQVFNNDLELLDSKPLEANSKPHGVAYCPKRNLLIAANSGQDKIVFYDASNHQKLDEIKLSDKFDQTGFEHHHINDVYVHGNSLYFTLFSITGNWRLGSYDGCLVEVPLDDLSVKNILFKDLWMPHSPCVINGEISFVDTMRGNIHNGGKHPIGNLPGFIRGLASDGRYFYIGTSENRYFDRLKGLSQSILVNGGFYLFDADSKATKFFSMPQVRQVHSLLPLKG